MCDEWEECLCEGGVHTSAPGLDELVVIITDHLTTVRLQYEKVTIIKN